MWTLHDLTELKSLKANSLRLLPFNTDQPICLKSVRKKIKGTVQTNIDAVFDYCIQLLVTGNFFHKQKNIIKTSINLSIYTLLD